MFEMMVVGDLLFFTVAGDPLLYRPGGQLLESRFFGGEKTVQG